MCDKCYYFSTCTHFLVDLSNCIFFWWSVTYHWIQAFLCVFFKLSVRYSGSCCSFSFHFTDHFQIFRNYCFGQITQLLCHQFCVLVLCCFCMCVRARSWLLLCFTSSFIKFIELPQYSAGVKAERRFIRGHDLCVTPSQRYQQALGFSSPGSPAGEASASGIRSLISPSCLRFLIEYLLYQPLYGWSHAAVLWLPFLTLTTCLVSAESVTHTQSPSYISTSVFVQLHTSSIWLHLAVLIHGFSDKGNTGRGQISPGWRCSFLREGTARVGL